MSYSLRFIDVFEDYGKRRQGKTALWQENELCLCTVRCVKRVCQVLIRLSMRGFSCDENRT